LGTASMVTRILCKHSGTDRGANKEICETPGEDG